MKLTVGLKAYQSLANRLRQTIFKGDLPPGSKLPTEFELCEQFGASRITVRRSLQILEEEMLIERRQGSGTYISQRPVRRIPVLDTDFSGSVRLHAPDLRRRVVSHGLLPVPEVQASLLDIKVGEQVLQARRVDSIGGKPVAFDDVFIPAAHSRHVNVNVLRKVHFAEAWASAQRLKFSHVRQSIEAAEADDLAVKMLNVPPQKALLRETATYFGDSGTAFGLFITYYRADIFRFTSVTPFGNSQQR